MAQHMVSNVYVQFNQCKRGEGADGLAPQVKVALDVAHSAVAPPFAALLHYGIGVAQRMR